MRFFAIACALLGAALAVPVGPASIASSDDTLVDRSHWRPSIRMVTLEIRNLSFWIDSLGRFELSQVNLAVGPDSATCRAAPYDKRKVLCNNERFKFRVSNILGLRKIRVTYQGAHILMHAERSLSLSRDVRRVQLGRKQVLLIPPN